MELSSPDPRVSIVIPAFNSDGTLAACLAALGAQTYSRFEVIVVDSTPADGDVAAHRERTRAIVTATNTIDVHLIQSARRLGPHDARNVSASVARGSLLAFIDPDIYPQRGWLEALVGAHARLGGVVYGPLACAGRRWFDIGVHLCKFPICLPEPAPRAVKYGWSGNMLCEREIFARVGGFPGRVSHGDTLLAVVLARAGVPLWFEPSAVVRHDHEGVGLGAFLRERFVRGAELARLSADGSLTGRPWAWPGRLRRVLTAPLAPIKIAVACAHVARAATRAGLQRELLMTFPVVLAGQTAWVAGATVASFGPAVRQPW